MQASSVLWDVVDYKFIDSAKSFLSHFGLKNGVLIVGTIKYYKIENQDCIL